MDLEDWLLELLDAIKAASDLEAAFDIHLEKKTVQEIAEQYKEMKGLELY